MNRLVLILSILCLLSPLLSPLAALAEDTAAAQPAPGSILYVSDELWITIRSEANADAEKVAVIPTGTRMTLVEYAADSEYAKIRTDKDQTGWVLFRYLTPKPVATLRLPEMELQLAEQQQKNQALNDKLAALSRESNALEVKLKEVNQQNQAINQELSEIKMISNEALQTHQEKQTLQQQLDTRVQQAENLAEETAILRDRLTLFTVISAIAGLLVGLYVGTIPLRRDKRWRSMP